LFLYLTTKAERENPMEKGFSISMSIDKLMLLLIISISAMSLFACSGSTDTRVTLQFGSSVSNLGIDDSTSGSGRSYTAASGLSDLTITVTGKGMDTIKSSVSAGAGLAVLFVPSGKNRKFTIEGSTSKWDYIGEALADLPEGEAVDIQVMLGMKQVVYHNGNSIYMRQSADDNNYVSSNEPAPNSILDIDFDIAGNMYILFGSGGSTYYICRNLYNCSKNDININVNTSLPIVSSTYMFPINHFVINRIKGSIYFTNSESGSPVIKEISLNSPGTPIKVLTLPVSNTILSMAYNEYTGLLTLIQMEGGDFPAMESFKQGSPEWDSVVKYNNTTDLLYSDAVITPYGKYLAVISFNYDRPNSIINFFKADSLEYVSGFGFEYFESVNDLQIVSKRSGRVVFHYNDNGDKIGSFFDFNGKSFTSVLLFGP
jgi:hypothetical protein